MRIFEAFLETAHFTFRAYGTTQAAAMAALKSGLKTHQSQYKLSAGWYEPRDIEVHDFDLGAAYRDGSRIA